MECSRIRAMLAEYVDDGLPGVERAALENHVQACKECQEELTALRLLLDAARTALRHPGPEDRLAALRRQIADEEAWRSTEALLTPRFDAWRLLRVAAMAAVFLLTAVAALPIIHASRNMSDGRTANEQHGAIVERVILTRWYIRQSAYPPAAQFPDDPARGDAARNGNAVCGTDFS